MNGKLYLNIRLYNHELCADRSWELRDNLSANDASSVALAEVIEFDLLPTDGRLANALATKSVSSWSAEI